MKYLIDFETKSGLSLPVVGTKRYVNDPQADIVCMSWKLWDDLELGTTRLWTPGMKFPFYPKPYDQIYAFNIQFDYEVWHTLGMKYYLPPFKLEQCVDVMALCGRYTYPQKLDFVARVLQLKVQKDRKGKALMNKICLPPFEYTRKDLADFYEYCVTDTDAMWELIKALPKDELDPKEQKIWVMTAKINRTGVPIDTRAVKRIREVTDYFKKKEMVKVSWVTDKVIQTVGQTKAIIMWAANEKGVKMPNLQAETVQEFIDEDANPDVTALLKLRQKLGRTSTAKYKRADEQTYEGRIYDNLRYYAASPGRWGGMGFQIHNMPRAKVKDPEATIRKFYDTSIVKGDPIFAAKALVRAMIKAPDGYVIQAADYSAIENVLLLWAAGEEKQLDLIRKGFSHYKTFAAAVYNISYDEVNDEQRFLGKTGVLGAGYNAAAGAFLKFAKGYGLDISYEKAEFVIRLFRQEHREIKKMWYSVKNCALAAIEHKGVTYGTNKCKFKCIFDRNGTTWLTIKLPSGRSLVYNSPEVRTDRFGPVPTHMGVNSYTNQWTRLKLIPGRITENIIQALARDILAHGKLRLMEEGFNVIGSIHDEVLCEEKEGCVKTPLDKMINVMCELPAWCTDLPLTATGFTAKRFRKD